MMGTLAFGEASRALTAVGCLTSRQIFRVLLNSRDESSIQLATLAHSQHTVKAISHALHAHGFFRKTSRRDLLWH